MHRRLAVLLALALPWEAHTSGSSTVRAEGAHLAVSLESGRKIFDRGEGEAEWHAEWRASHQPEVDAVLARLEPALAVAASREGLTLTGWAEALPEAWSWAQADHDMSPARVCAASPCRVRVQLWATGVPGVPAMDAEIALAAAPPAGALPRVAEALARALVAPEP